MRKIVNSEESLSKIIGEMRETFKKHKYFSVNLIIGKHRGINLNYVTHGWYKKVSLELGEYTPGQIKCLCKYNCGLPIMRADDEHFNDVCENVIDPLPYESRIEAMELMPVTSLMTNPQHLLYCDHVQKNYALRGVILDFPKKEDKK